MQIRLFCIRMFNWMAYFCDIKPGNTGTHFVGTFKLANSLKSSHLPLSLQRMIRGISSLLSIIDNLLFPHINVVSSGTD